MGQHATSNHLGTHAIVELFGCEHLNDLSLVRDTLTEAARLCGATVLHTKFHQFSPQGLTGYILLAESHISIHTWPEYGYAAVDLFTCGSMDTKKAFAHIAKQLGASRVARKTLLRGKKDSFVPPRASISIPTPALAS